MCKEPILSKLGFSSNFPRDVMHVSKESLGLGLFLPSTMVAIQGLRMCLGNKRIKSNAARTIKVLEEQTWVEGGLNGDPVNNRNKSYWTESWIDETKQHLKKRNITVCSKQNQEMEITKNATIMEYALNYSDKVLNDENAMKHINHLRLCKKVFLPFELVGSSGREETLAFQEEETTS